MKRLITLISLFCLIASNSLVHAGVKIAHWRAPSGARVYFIEAPGLPILDVQIDFAAGGRYAPPGLAGVAGLTHGLLDTGAADLDEEQIAARLVDTGARLSGSVDADKASIALRTLSSLTERDAALLLLRAVVSAPTFPAAVLDREKGRSIAAIREAATRADAIAGKRFAAAIYPGHPYGTAPDATSVAAITRDDVQAFYRARYTASNAVISLIGAITRAEAEQIAQRLSEALPAAGSANPPAAAVPAVKKPAATLIKVEHPATQSHIHIGLPAIARNDADYFPLLVGNYSLGGGGFVSRLMQEVREKRGYVYDISSHFAPRQLPGPFEISLQTRRDQAQVAIKLVNEVVDDFIAKGPTAKELAAAKKNMIDGMALRLDSNAKLLGYLSAIGFYGLPLTYIDDFPARVQAVTRHQVQEAFARHVTRENLVTVIVAAD